MFRSEAGPHLRDQKRLREVLSSIHRMSCQETVNTSGNQINNVEVIYGIPVSDFACCFTGVF